MDDRLTNLELRYMQQELTLQDLSETVYQQELAILQLQRELRQLGEQLKLALPSLTRSPEEEDLPPHY